MSLCTLGNLFTNNECLYGYQWWLWCNHVMWLSSSSMVLQLHTINTVHTLTPTLLTKPPSPHTHVCAQYKPITYVSFSHTVHTVQTWPLHCSHIVHNQHTHTHTHTANDVHVWVSLALHRAAMWDLVQSVWSIPLRWGSRVRHRGQQLHLWGLHYFSGE